MTTHSIFDSAFFSSQVCNQPMEMRYILRYIFSQISRKNYFRNCLTTWSTREGLNLRILLIVDNISTVPLSLMLSNTMSRVIKAPVLPPPSLQNRWQFMWNSIQFSKLAQKFAGLNNRELLILKITYLTNHC